MYKRTFMQTLAAVAMMLLPAACADDYDDSALWDKVNDHEERLAALEKWQEQTNQSIAAMQELLNTTDMITGVSAVSEGGQTVGYTITFLHSDPITIYNGAKGEDGADGQTPQIGLAQAEDGNWYWTLNGELLTDAQGNPIRANGLDGADGADGEDGEDGATGPEGPQGNDGTSAPTPQILLGSSITSGTIKTDNGQKDTDAWYLSVDGGATWYRVSGKDGTNGDAWFSDEPKKEGNYYVFTLTNQSTFRVAAYQPFRILTEAEKDGTTTFTNATVTINGATTFYLYIDNDIKYQEIVAQISSVDAVLTRADVSDWTVVKGTEQNTLTVTPGTQPYALLDVSLLLTDGSKLTASRLLEDPGYTVDGNTYIVASAEGLKNIASLVNSGATGINITLDTDLDLTDMEWTPIGADYNNAYTGIFDGNGKTITGLTFNQSETSNVGLIGYLGSGGKVQNLTLENVNLNGDWDVGGVVGYNNNGTVTACTASGSINGKEYVGGIVGNNYLGTVTACYNTSSTVNGSYLIGGVVGQNNKGIVTACYNASGSIYGEVTVGGVVGNNNTGTVTACYWSNYAGYGIGNGTGDATKVDDTTVTWQTAVDAMNAAIETWNTANPDKTCDWRYELGDEGLPVLTQQP